MSTNLFAKAKKNGTVKTSSKEDTKPRVTVEDPEVFEKISDMVDLQATIKRSEGELAKISDEIRTLSKEKWSEMYEKNGMNPGSIMIESVSGGDVAQVMYVPSDRYIAVGEDQAEKLREEYGDDIIEESTTFSFDADMIEKYGEVLSDLIQNCEGIADKDKSRIIKAVTKMNIAKGTIDNLSKYGDVAQVLEDVKPVMSLKGAEIIKG